MEKTIAEILEDIDNVLDGDWHKVRRPSDNYRDVCTIELDGEYDASTLRKVADLLQQIKE